MLLLSRQKTILSSCSCSPCPVPLARPCQLRSVCIAGLLGLWSVSPLSCCVCLDAKSSLVVSMSQAHPPQTPQATQERALPRTSKLPFYHSHSRSSRYVLLATRRGQALRALAWQVGRRVCIPVPVLDGGGWAWETPLLFHRPLPRLRLEPHHHPAPAWPPPRPPDHGGAWGWLHERASFDVEGDGLGRGWAGQPTRPTHPSPIP